MRREQHWNVAFTLRWDLVPFKGATAFITLEREVREIRVTFINHSFKAAASKETRGDEKLAELKS